MFSVVCILLKLPFAVTYLAAGVYICAAMIAPVKSNSTTITHMIHEKVLAFLLEPFFRRFQSRRAQENMMKRPPIMRKAAWLLTPPELA